MAMSYVTLRHTQIHPPASPRLTDGAPERSPRVAHTVDQMTGSRSNGEIEYFQGLDEEYPKNTIQWNP